MSKQKFFFFSFFSSCLLLAQTAFITRLDSSNADPRVNTLAAYLQKEAPNVAELGMYLVRTAIPYEPGFVVTGLAPEKRFDDAKIFCQQKGWSLGTNDTWRSVGEAILAADQVETSTRISDDNVWVWTIDSFLNHDNPLSDGQGMKWGRVFNVRSGFLIFQALYPQQFRCVKTIASW